jgi:Suppressor of fused protein (SUFU)
MTDLDTRRAFARDVRRSIMLATYIKFWRMPDQRRVSRKGDDTVEVYSFPASEDTRVHRFVTIGASTVPRQDGRAASFELFMALPSDLGGAPFNAVTSFLLDVFVHGLRSDVVYSNGYTIAPTALAPPQWGATALLFDEPTGEPEEIATFHIGPTHVNVYWVIPIYASEFQLIQRDRVDAFFALAQSSDASLADPNRPPLVSIASVGHQTD